tara:strand:+ start:6108 stop:6227 length:120 start_codon:yes stop_codon:yes gene_type:complete
MNKIEKAIKHLMEYIGKPYYCSACEDWFEEGHFEFTHKQ